MGHVPQQYNKLHDEIFRIRGKILHLYFIQAYLLVGDDTLFSILI
jgi:hypothetical protein